MKFFKQIKKNKLFCDLTDKEIETLFDCYSARIEKTVPRDIILRPGDTIDYLCIILEGNLVEFTVKSNGEKTVISSKVDGDMFGLPYCFGEKNKAESYITSATESCLLYITADCLLSNYGEEISGSAKVMKNLVGCLCDSLLELKCNNDFITIKGMRKKIAKFIYDKYEEQRSLTVQLGVDRNGLAKYLNVSRPSMSREMISEKD